ncbi:MAG: GNAT family N-acetyltransferase [Bacteroidaceae bacterium]|nr:GNAT family N-acetyltransferase [Bacteroidaceae bacterium]
MNADVTVYVLRDVQQRHVEAVNTLLGQLSSTPNELSKETLDAIVSSANSTLFVAETEGRVAGMLTLAHYLAPTGLKMWIEDVVVDKNMRGRSIGRLLVENAIAHAHQLGKGTLMLTSRPSREAANALYRSCGFKFKETNNYTMRINE